MKTLNLNPTFLGLDLRDLGQTWGTAIAAMFEWPVVRWLSPSYAVRILLPDGTAVMGRERRSHATLQATSPLHATPCRGYLLPPELVLRQDLRLPPLRGKALRAAVELHTQRINPFPEEDLLWTWMVEPAPAPPARASKPKNKSEAKGTNSGHAADKSAGKAGDGSVTASKATALVSVKSTVASAGTQAPANWQLTIHLAITSRKLVEQHMATLQASAMASPSASHAANAGQGAGAEPSLSPTTAPETALSAASANALSTGAVTTAVQASSALSGKAAVRSQDLLPLARAEIWTPLNPLQAQPQAGAQSPTCLIFEGPGKARRHRWIARWRALNLVLVMLLLLVGVTAAVTPSAQLRFRAIDAHAQFAALQAKSSPAVAERIRMTQLQDKLRQIKEPLESRVVPEFAILMITRYLPDDAYLLALDIKGDLVTLAGLTPNATTLMLHLGSQPGVKGIRAVDPTTRQRDRELFKFEFTLQPTALPDPL